MSSGKWSMRCRLKSLEKEGVAYKSVALATPSDCTSQNVCLLFNYPSLHNWTSNKINLSHKILCLNAIVKVINRSLFLFSVNIVFIAMETTIDGGFVNGLHPS